MSRPVLQLALELMCNAVCQNLNCWTVGYIEKTNIVRLSRPTKKKTRLAIILHYCLYNITIILGECCPEKNNNIS